MFQAPRGFDDLSLMVRPLANAKAEIVEMPRATAYLVNDGRERISRTGLTCLTFGVQTQCARVG
jgi:hypothetical protein